MPLRSFRKFAAAAAVCCAAAQMTSGTLYGQSDAAAQNRMRMLLQTLDLSARAYDRVLKVARTIADLAGAESVTEEHVAEASAYRELDRNYWN